MKSKRLAKGFSLVELMVVISIIVILISFVLPSVSAVQKNVDTVRCAAKLKQIHQAMVAWAWDHNKKLPSSRQGKSDSWVGWGWNDQSKNIIKPNQGYLWDYMNNDADAYLCPAFVELYKNSSNGSYGPNNEPAFTYSMNEYVGNGWKGKPPLNYLETVPNPDSLHMVGDENFWKVPGLSNYIINNGAMGVGTYGNNNLVDCLGSFHQPPAGDINDGFSNVAFVDGHVVLVHVAESKEVVTPDRWK